jgi:hypothetical protein
MGLQNMKNAARIPFTDEGRIEAETTKLVSTRLEEAWYQEIERMPGLTEENRKTAAGSEDLVSAPGKYKVGFHLSKTRRVIAIQGGWWYRGVTCAEVEPEGTRISYIMVNVAPGVGKWIAHFFQAREARGRLGL